MIDPGALNLKIVSETRWGSGIYPGSWFLSIQDGSRVPDPGSNNNERGEKFVVFNFFCNYKFYKIVNYFIFEQIQKKNWAHWQRVVVLLTQKLLGNALIRTQRAARRWELPANLAINLVREMDWKTYLKDGNLLLYQQPSRGILLFSRGGFLLQKRTLYLHIVWG